MMASADVDPDSEGGVRTVPVPLANRCAARRACRSCAGIAAVLTLGLVLSVLASRFLNSKQLVGVSAPTQVAIAAGNFSDTEVAFTWLTDDPRDDAASCKDVAAVEINSPAAVRAEFECLRYTYAASNSWLLHSTYTSGRIHHVRIGNLTPNTTYRYSLAGDTDRLHRTFSTLPATSSQNAYPLTFGVVGDLGQTDASVHTVRQLDVDPEIQMVLHAGDMAYADSNAVRWDSYGEKVEPLSSRTQWMVCPGNHEIESDTKTGYNFVPYEARFAMPRVRPPVTQPSPSQRGCQHPWPYTPFKGPDCTPSVFQGNYDWGNSFYAFTAGPARIISLNSYTDTSPGSPQYTWLKSELAALRARRQETPWLIVQMHCPFYHSNKAHSEERQTVAMRDHFEDLFFENQVSVVLTGHVHAYERSFPVYRQAVNPKGPTYMVIGDGGNREGHARNYHSRPLWSAFRNGTLYGHGKITLLNSTHMRWEWMVDDVSRVPALSKEAAASVADRHAKGGSSSTRGPTSPWRSALVARAAEDAAWIVNPWSPHRSVAAEQVHDLSTVV